MARPKEVGGSSIRHWPAQWTANQPPPPPGKATGLTSPGTITSMKDMQVKTYFVSEKGDQKWKRERGGGLPRHLTLKIRTANWQQRGFSKVAVGCLDEVSNYAEKSHKEGRKDHGHSPPSTIPNPWNPVTRNLFFSFEFPLSFELTNNEEWCLENSNFISSMFGLSLLDYKHTNKN